MEVYTVQDTLNFVRELGPDKILYVTLAAAGLSYAAFRGSGGKSLYETGLDRQQKQLRERLSREKIR